jgi:hypothetical protein
MDYWNGFAAGAAVSTFVFGAEIRAIAISFSSSTGEVRVNIVSPNDTAVSSSADRLWNLRNNIHLLID